MFADTGVAGAVSGDDLANDVADDAAGAAHCVVSLALGCAPRSVPTPLPAIDFLSRSSKHDPAYPRVAAQHRATARQVLTDAFRWCAARFPLVIGPEGTGAPRPAIRYLDVRSTGAGELLGASSADVPGHVVLGASWPAVHRYRLASLIAHEAVHQALFVREAAGGPVRPGSLGYSPWRRTVRPGRSVWHAFWTFSSQFSLLAAAVAENARIADEDAGVHGFLAEMAARVEICLDSLRQFTVIGPDELRRCDQAVLVVQDAAQRLCVSPAFDAALTAERDSAAADYRSWAEQMVSR